MTAFLFQRAVTLALTLFAATIAIFLLLEVVPGDPALTMMGMNADPAAVEALRRDLGLDAPMVQRYASWVWDMLRGDFGVSYTYKTPVAELVLERLEVTLPLTLYALTLSTLIAIPAGVAAAARRGGPADLGIMGITQIGIAVPNFWFAMLLVILFASVLQMFQAGGFPGWEEGLGAGMKALTLPAVALALPQASILTRIMRSALLDAMGEDYVRTARAKGLTRGQALRRHALRNALIPVLTIIGMQFSFLITGAIIIENVFFLPGLGRLVFQGIVQRDLIVVKSVIVLLVFMVVAVTLLVDMAYAMVDPRLKEARK